MNGMPTDWSEQLQESYPRRSGPCGWRGMRLMMAVRRALIESDWSTIMQGVKGYAEYCEKSGKEGTEFVLSPQNFFEQGIHLENLIFEQPKSKDDLARETRAAAESQRWEKAKREAQQLRDPLSPTPGESVAAFETRVMLASQGLSGEKSVRRLDVSSLTRKLSHG